MAAFDYVAINPNGKKEKGVIAAESLEIARRELRNRKLAPVKVSEVNRENILDNGRSKEASDNFCMPIKEILTLIPENY